MSCCQQQLQVQANFIDTFLNAIALPSPAILASEQHAITILVPAYQRCRVIVHGIALPSSLAVPVISAVASPAAPPIAFALP